MMKNNIVSIAFWCVGLIGAQSVRADSYNTWHTLRNESNSDIYVELELHHRWGECVLAGGCCAVTSKTLAPGHTTLLKASCPVSTITVIESQSVGGRRKNIKTTKLSIAKQQRFVGNGHIDNFAWIYKDGQIQADGALTQKLVDGKLSEAHVPRPEAEEEKYFGPIMK